jgi:hypothetical protein|tara:strand:+ start:173 stop:811 length:639 start_codon:yes stop_codon:yes gene_type:complete
MALTTYSGLKTAIPNWVENDATEFTDILDDIILLAEERCFRDLKLDEFQKYASGKTMTASDREIPKPADFVNTLYIAIVTAGSETHLIKKSVAFLDEYWPLRTATSTPVYYADKDDDTWIVAPTPNIAYAYEAAYTFKPTGLSASNTTSWFSTEATDLLFFACLVESEKFMKSNIEDIQLWKASYSETLNSLRQDEEFKQRRDAFRQGEKVV